MTHLAKQRQRITNQRWRSNGVSVNVGDIFQCLFADIQCSILFSWTVSGLTKCRLSRRSDTGRRDSNPRLETISLLSTALASSRSPHDHLTLGRPGTTDGLRGTLFVAISEFKSRTQFYIRGYAVKMPLLSTYDGA